VALTIWSIARRFLVGLQAAILARAMLCIGRHVLPPRMLVILVYFLPTMAASRYRHPKQPAILVLNILLECTVVGSVIASLSPKHIFPELV
jgi:hypothetical protein